MKLKTQVFELSDTSDYARAVLAQINTTRAMVSKTTEMVEQTVSDISAAVAETGYLTKNIDITKTSRLKSSAYNDLVDNMRLDLSVTYSRLNGLVGMMEILRKSSTYMINQLTARLNILNSRLRSFSTLNNLRSQYDNIIINTFTTDDSTNEDRMFAAKRHTDGNLLSLNTVAFDGIITNQYNYDMYVYRLNKDLSLNVKGDNLTADAIHSGLALTLLGKKKSTIKDYYVGRGARISFDGAVIALVLDLADTKLINHISFGMFGSGPVEVLGAYYSTRRTIAPGSTKWMPITITTDSTNISGITMKFAGIEASSIMVVIGQRYENSITMPVEQYKIENSGTTLQSLRKNLLKIDFNNTGTYLKSYVPASVTDFISDSAKAIIGGILGIMERMIPQGEPRSIITVHKYDILLYGLDVLYTHNQGASTYKSPYYGNKGDMEKISLRVNDVIPAGTHITYKVQTETGSKRIIPMEHITEVTKDVLLITDITRKAYDTDFIIDTSVAVSVLLNETDISSEITLRKPIANVEKAIGITLSDNINPGFNDQLTIIYTRATLDLKNDEVLAYERTFDEMVSNPTYKIQGLKCDKSRLLIMNSNDVPVSYNLTTEVLHMKLPLIEGRSIEETGYRLKTLKGNDFSGAQELEDGSFVVDDSLGMEPGSAIYAGILDEMMYVSSGEPVFRVEHEYVPGTLNVFTYNPETGTKQKVGINEYMTDVSGTVYDKDTFTSAAGSLNGHLIASYVPISGDYESNIAKPNKAEYYNHTAADGTIDLKFAPFIDTAILYDANRPIPVWAYAAGVFVLVADPDIKYEPIQIMVKGYRALNRTDYKTGDIPQLQEFSLNRRNYEYYVRGNRIFFNTNIILPITILYYARPDWYRILIELRRTNLKDDTISPLVYDYAILCDQRET